MTRVPDHATRERSRVALVTCADVPGPRGRRPDPLRDALRERGVRVDAVRWDDPAADWAAYDLVVLRSPWDYAARRDEFVAWAHTRAPAGQPGRRRRVEHRQALPARAGRRRRAGHARPTFVAPGDAVDAAGDRRVGGQAHDQRRQPGHRPLPPARAGATWRSRTCAASPTPGRTAMIQPYLTAVDTAGETAVLCTPDADRRAHLQPRDPQGPDAHRPGPAAPAFATTTEEISPRDADGRRAGGRERARWRPCPAAPSGCSTRGWT